MVETKLIDWILPLLGLILDIGNIIFFISNFPQLIRTIKNKNKSSALEGLDEKTMIGYIFATLFFFIVAFATDGYIASTLCIINIIIYSLQIYWKYKNIKSTKKRNKIKKFGKRNI